MGIAGEAVLVRTFDCIEEAPLDLSGEFEEARNDSEMILELVALVSTGNDE